MNVATHRTVPELFSDLINQLTSLFRTEARLARAEISEKLSKAGSAVGLIVAGAVLLIPALVILLQAAVAALEEQGLAPYWAALAIGGGVLIIGLILAGAGFSALKPSKLMPNKTVEQLQQDAAVARGQVG